MPYHGSILSENWFTGWIVRQKYFSNTPVVHKDTAAKLNFKKSSKNIGITITYPWSNTEPLGPLPFRGTGRCCDVVICLLFLDFFGKIVKDRTGEKEREILHQKQLQIRDSRHLYFQLNSWFWSWQYEFWISPYLTPYTRGENTTLLSICLVAFNTVKMQRENTLQTEAWEMFDLWYVNNASLHFLCVYIYI